MHVDVRVDLEDHAAQELQRVTHVRIRTGYGVVTSLRTYFIDGAPQDSNRS